MALWPRSPVKSGKKAPYSKYYTGKLTDGKNTMRLVSFDCKSRPEMERCCREKVPVAIANCALKPSPYDGKYELLASPRKTSLERSERVFNLPADLDAIDPDYAKTISLDEISVLVPNQQVNVCVKVLEVYGITEVTKKGTWKSLEKQEVLVADHSDTIRLVLWEKDVCRLEKGKSYKLSSVNTRSFKERAYLSVSDCTSITAIDDIGDVAEQDPDEEHTLVGDETFTGDVVSVTSVDVYKSCMACSGKGRVEPQWKACSLHQMSCDAESHYRMRRSCSRSGGVAGKRRKSRTTKSYNLSKRTIHTCSRLQRQV